MTENTPKETANENAKSRDVGELLERIAEAMEQQTKALDAIRSAIVATSGR